MGIETTKFFKLLLLTLVITFVLFYLFEEDRQCVLDFGSKCSNSFILKSSIQSLLLTCIFFFSNRLGKKTKE